MEGEWGSLEEAIEIDEQSYFLPSQRTFLSTQFLYIQKHEFEKNKAGIGDVYNC